MLRTNNPTLNVFAKAQTWDDFYGKGGAGAGTIARERPTTMTIQGAVTKTLILLSVCGVTAVAVYVYLISQGGLGAGMSTTALGLMAGGAIVGLILGWIMCSKPTAAPVLAPIYSVFEGLFVGAVSAAYASHPKWGGNSLVLQAGLLTVGILGALLIAYKMRLITVSNTFRRVVVAATGGVVFMWIACLVVNVLFPSLQFGYIWSWGPLGLGIAAAIVVLAAMNLCLDFDRIEQGARANLPRAYEWYAGFALLASLVWLYVSILRLLAMLADRR